MAAPPKPWERAGVNYQSSSSLLDNNMSSGPQMGPGGAAGLGLPSALPTTTAAPPAPPPRPSTMTNSFNRSMYGGGGYGGYSGMYGSGFGSMGSMYSPYGGGGLGYGSYGYNRFGMQGDVPGSSFARVAEENSRPAFQSIESIVHAVSSVAMMLDSSFQAVYSSFRAVIGVADNFSRLKTQMVQIFSALAMIRTLRYLIRRFLEFLRLRPAGQAEREWREALAQAAGSLPAAGDGEPKKSAWPIFMFFGIILGGPYLIWKLISSFSTDPQGGEPWTKGESDHVVAQALYGFTGQSDEELSFSAGQQLILAPKELQPNVRGWLLGSVGGRKGLVPYNYIKVLGKRKGQVPVPSLPDPTASVANQNSAAQNFTSAFSQAAVTPAFSPAAGTSSPATAMSKTASDATNNDELFPLTPAQPSVPDLDSVFGSMEQSGVPVVDGQQFTPPTTSSQRGEDMNAAEILDKATGE